MCAGCADYGSPPFVHQVRKLSAADSKMRIIPSRTSQPDDNTPTPRQADQWQELPQQADEPGR